MPITVSLVDSDGTIATAARAAARRPSQAGTWQFKVKGIGLTEPAARPEFAEPGRFPVKVIGEGVVHRRRGEPSAAHTQLIVNSAARASAKR